MRKALFALVAALGLMLAFPVAAAADHAVEWTANQDSFIVNETTVHLEGENTSVETTELNPHVDPGTKVAFEYVLHGTECDSNGDVYVFVEINSTYHNTDDISGGACGSGGKVEFEVPAGVVTHIGVVHYQPGKEGYTEISNLKIGDELVHFMNPKLTEVAPTEPTVTDETCDGPGTLTLADDEGVQWSIGDKSVDPGALDTDPGEVHVTATPAEGYVLDGEVDQWTLTVGEASDCETSSPESTPEPTDDATPAASQETLPETGGASIAWLVVLGVALVLFGAGAVVLRRT